MLLIARFFTFIVKLSCVIRFISHLVKYDMRNYSYEKGSTMEILKRKKYLWLHVVVTALVMIIFSQQAFASSKNILKDTLLYEGCEGCHISDVFTHDSGLKLLFLRGAEFETTEIVAFNKDNSVKWHKKYDFFVPWIEPTISADGTIYLGAVGHVVALDANGNEKWRFPVEKGAATTPLEGSDGMLYIGEFNWTDYVGPYSETNIYAITKNGKLKWENKVQGQASFELLNNSTLLVNAGADLLNFELNGDLIWKYTATSDEYEPYIETVVFGDVIYGNSIEATFALNFDGKEMWKNELSGSGLFRLTEGNKNYLVYETSDENGIPRLNAMTLDGKQAWSYKVNVPYNPYNDYYIDIYPAEQSLYVATDNKLTKINIEGEEEYTVDTGGFISDFTLTDELAYLAVSDFDTNTYEIHSLDLNNGETLNSLTLDSYPLGIISDEQNNLYFGSENHLYMLKANDSSVEDPEYKLWKKQFVDVETSKQWNVDFNQGLNEETVNNDTISISLLGETAKVPLGFQLSEDKKSITIIPTEHYENARTYQLRIKGVESLNGIELADPIVMTFTIKE